MLLLDQWIREERWLNKMKQIQVNDFLTQNMFMIRIVGIDLNSLMWLAEIMSNES